MASYHVQSLFLLLAASLPGVALLAQTDELKIIVIEGDNAVNNIRRGVTTKPVVEVRDKNDRPVAGVILTFSAPRSGAGGVFPGGADFLTIATDANGRASATFQPNTVAGEFVITVTASYQGQTGRTTIKQKNVTPPAAGVSGKTIGILAAVGVAAAVGAAVTLAGGNGGSSTPTPTPTPTAAPTVRIGVGPGPIQVEPRP
jgi:hypothetical protein